ncbi:MAG: hypothetical protein SPJ11_01465 [Coprococcus catus]|nr:hypothetical protein [Coprococcus catus]
MDKDILIQYSDLVEEVKDLRRRIRKLQDDIDKLEPVKDSVKGTRRDGTIGSITISGYPVPVYYRYKNQLEKREAALRKKEAELLELVNTVEEYITGINDSKMRRILRYRYIDNMSWTKIAFRMGKRYTAEGCRMLHNRFFEESR